MTVRDPLRAGVLILDDGTTKAAIVTMDVLQAWDALVPLARQKIEAATGVPAANIMITASHNHSGPPYDPLNKWGRELLNKLKGQHAIMVVEHDMDFVRSLDAPVTVLQRPTTSHLTGSDPTP